MKTEKETSEQPKGKTIFIEYSTWKKGQHFITVLQTIPGENKKVLIGRISHEKDLPTEKKYAFRSPNHTASFIAFRTPTDAKKYAKENGDDLAKQEIRNQKILAKDNNELPTRETEKITKQVTERTIPTKNISEKMDVSKPETPEKEIEEIRARKAEKSQDKNITR